MLVPVLGLLVPALVLSQSPLDAPRAGDPVADPGASALFFGDIDQDGLDDALLIGSDGAVTLLANRGQGRFEDVTLASGLAELSFATCALFADFDGDGRLDLFLGSSEERLWRNLGQGAFEPLDAGLEHDLVDLAAAALDHDSDGRLDLHLATEAGHVLYRNAGDGRFERVELPGAGHPVGGPSAPSTSSAGGLSSGASLSPAGSASGEDKPARQRQLRWLRTRGERTGTDQGTGAEQGDGASPDPSLLGPLGGGSTPLGPTPLAGDPLLICAAAINDQATSQCIGVSSVPMQGKLYPLSSELFVDAATGNVGVGTLTPLYALHVDGKLVSGVSTSASGTNAAVGGGASNSASGAHATVAGGESNTAGTSHAFVGGGISNTTTGTRAVIGGGISNTAGNSSVVGGGSNNDASFNFSTVAGGRLNTADATYATIGGGASNTASGQYAFVGGGGEDGVPTSGNTASGLAASVPGGRANVAAGTTSLAAGQRAKALHDGSFVWADSQAADFASSAPNQFAIRAAGGVGIGTASPTAGLHVASNAGLLTTGTIGLGTIPVEGTGTRMMWYPGKAAFRVGYAAGSEWNAVNVGTYSVAMGGGASASGSFSVAMGGATSASGPSSTAMGYNTDAIGSYSTAMGLDTSANGDTSTAMGNSTDATGEGSTAMGDSTVASGLISTAMGRLTQALGNASTALGDSTVASGVTSTAMGAGTDAIGGVSTAMGSSTVASGNYSTTTGHATKAEALASMAVGRYNLGGGNATTWVATDPLLEVGNGTSDFARANAVTVLKNGNVGIATSSPGFRLHVEGGSDAAPGGGGYAQFGSTSGSNVVIDNNEIMARDNGATRLLSLNADGGNVHISENGTGNLGVGRSTTANRLEVEGNASKTAAGSWLANSDRRIKTDVRTIEGALDTLERVRAVSFRYTDEYRAEHPSLEDKDYYNVIAQEFAQVFPDYVQPSGEGDILQVDTYPALIHALAAIRELRAEKDRETAELRAQGEAQAAEVAALRAELGELRLLVQVLAPRPGPQEGR